MSNPDPIVVINDVLPDVETDSGQRLGHLLKVLRELGHPVTFIARDSKKQEALGLSQQGISLYAGDSERLPALGKDGGSFSWSLGAVLAEKQFSAAILLQNFRCGISIPEHYLNAIRRSSPQARVLVLNDALHGKSARRRFEITQQLEHHEVAEDRVARAWEAFHRADLVLVRNANDEAWLRQSNPTIETAVITPWFEGKAHDRGWKERHAIRLTIDLAQSGDVDGFGWFLEKVWPKICRESSDLELWVAGADKLPLESRQKLARVKWLEAKNLEQSTAKAGIYVAPLRFGRIPDSLAPAGGIFRAA